MKWIHNMLTDGSYYDFRNEYIKCILTNKDSFKWEGRIFRKTYAKGIIRYTDSYIKEQGLTNKVLSNEIFNK